MTDYLIKYTVYTKNMLYKKKGEVTIQEGISYRDNKGNVIIVVNKEDAKNFLINSFNSKDRLNFLDNFQLPKENIRLSVNSIYKINVT